MAHETRQLFHRRVGARTVRMDEHEQRRPLDQPTHQQYVNLLPAAAQRIIAIHPIGRIVQMSKAGRCMTRDDET